MMTLSEIAKSDEFLDICQCRKPVCEWEICEKKFLPYSRNGHPCPKMSCTKETVRKIERAALRKLRRQPELIEILLQYEDLSEVRCMWQRIFDMASHN